MPNKAPKNHQTANGEDGKIDSVVSSIFHEISEVVTDPDSKSGWVSVEPNPDDGLENGDLCEGKVPVVQEVPNKPGHYYNIKLGNEYYLIQTNYKQDGDGKNGECVAKIFGSK